jgi:peptide subunit release factor RF-3
MDSAHRDRIAYARVCSGTFERGDVLTHAATGKPFVTKYAQSVFGQQRSTLDSAWPGVASPQATLGIATWKITTLNASQTDLSTLSYRQKRSRTIQLP